MFSSDVSLLKKLKDAGFATNEDLEILEIAQPAPRNISESVNGTTIDVSDVEEIQSRTNGWIGDPELTVNEMKKYVALRQSVLNKFWEWRGVDKACNSFSSVEAGAVDVTTLGALADCDVEDKILYLATETVGVSDDIVLMAIKQLDQIAPGKYAMELLEVLKDPQNYRINDAVLDYIENSARRPDSAVIANKLFEKINVFRNNIDQAGFKIVDTLAKLGGKQALAKVLVDNDFYQGQKFQAADYLAEMGAFEYKDAVRKFLTDGKWIGVGLGIGDNKKVSSIVAFATHDDLVKISKFDFRECWSEGNFRKEVFKAFAQKGEFDLLCKITKKAAGKDHFVLRTVLEDISNAISESVSSVTKDDLPMLLDLAEDKDYRTAFKGLFLAISRFQTPNEIIDLMKSYSDEEDTPGYAISAGLSALANMNASDELWKIATGTITLSEKGEDNNWAKFVAHRELENMSDLSAIRSEIVSMALTHSDVQKNYKSRAVSLLAKIPGDKEVEDALSQIIWPLPIGTEYATDDELKTAAVTALAKTVSLKMLGAVVASASLPKEIRQAALSKLTEMNFDKDSWEYSDLKNTLINIYQSQGYVYDQLRGVDIPEIYRLEAFEKLQKMNGKTN